MKVIGYVYILLLGLLLLALNIYFSFINLFFFYFDVIFSFGLILFYMDPLLELLLIEYGLMISGRLDFNKDSRIL